jgi:zinc transporter ZupT
MVCNSYGVESSNTGEKSSSKKGNHSYSSNDGGKGGHGHGSNSHGHGHGDGDDHDHFNFASHNNSPLVAYVLVLALSFHSIFEGIALGTQDEFGTTVSIISSFIIFFFFTLLSFSILRPHMLYESGMV